MKWFAKIVGKSYAYTELLIKTRQNKVNKGYKIAKAEKEAQRLMDEQFGSKSPTETEVSAETKAEPKLKRRSVDLEEFDEEDWTRFFEELGTV